MGGGRGGGGGVRERLKWTKAIEMHSLSSEPFIPGCIPCDSRAEETPRSSKIFSCQKHVNAFEIRTKVQCGDSEDMLPRDSLKFRPSKMRPSAFWASCVNK